MTTLRFDNLPALTRDLAFDLIERLAGREGVYAQFGKSNQSCSAYVNVTVEDEDGGYVDDGEFKVRFSDHSDRHGSDITIRIDTLIETIEEEGEYIATEIEEYRYQAALDQAFEAATAFIAKVR